MPATTPAHAAPAQALFRALPDAKEESVWLSASPRAAVRAGSSLLALASCLTAFLLNLPYTEKVAASGATQPLTPAALVRSPGDGLVTAVHVVEGQTIEAGAELVTLAQGSGIHEDLSAIAARRRALARRIALAEQRAANLDALHQSRTEHLHLSRRAAVTMVRNLAAQLEGFRSAQDLAAAQHHDTVALLGRGAVSRREVQATQLALLRARSSALQVGAEHDQALLQARQAGQQITELALEHELALRNVNAELAMLRGEHAALTVAEHTTLVAPRDGEVADMWLTPGQSVTAGALLMHVAQPADDHLVVLQVPTAAAGRLREGQSVRLRYQAYPYAKFGFADGHILHIGRRRAADSDAFRVEVSVTQLPEGFGAVRHGMLVDADVVLDAQPIWRWLAEPLMRMARRL